jgi:small subunit ribosomal protein S19e
MSREIFEKPPREFILKLAQALKEIPEFKMPEWALYVKTSSAKEQPPLEKDFWYIRAASVLRQLYIRGVVGVGKLKTRYGSKKTRGVKPAKFRKAGGKIIRIILQQAEAAGLVEKINKKQFGRRLTKKGRDFLDSIKLNQEGIENVGFKQA